MFRLASVVGIVALTLAAAALATAAQHPAKQVPQENDTQDDAVLRITSALGQTVPCFHARFSLN
jgi:hypothetical protein